MGFGKTRWLIAEGYLPPLGAHPQDRTRRSHEAACILNAGNQDAELNITLFFSDREPACPYRLQGAARRTLHLRFDDLQDPEPIPRETDYASLIESSVPVVVQHTRLDARSGSLMTSIAYGCD